MTLSKHYSLEDFEQPSQGRHAAVPYPGHLIETRLLLVVNVLELLIKRLGARATVLSAFRDAGYNARVRGQRDSAHCEGYAVDLWVPRVSPEIVFKALYQMQLDGTRIETLGLFPHGVHMDVRPPLESVAEPLRETLCVRCKKTVTLCRETGCEGTWANP